MTFPKTLPIRAKPMQNANDAYLSINNQLSTTWSQPNLQSSIMYAGFPMAEA